MDSQKFAWRTAAAGVLCILAVGGITRFTGLRQWLGQPDTEAFLIYKETGQDVRFSSSFGYVFPYPAESPPPLYLREETVGKTALPVFAPEEAGEVYNTAGKQPDTGALLTGPLSWNLTGEEPTVLILHTHATESYTREKLTYEELSQWRTLDENYNMLSVGDRVTEKLEEGGIRVIHDRTIHDHPSYNGSYAQSRKTAKRLLEEYPSIQLILDLHRDASDESGPQLRTRATVNGARSAQLMLVLGCNHEKYEENLALGLKLNAVLERKYPGITRPLWLRESRFNQDLSPGALLVEVGAAGNTHGEAILAAEALAEGILELARGTGNTDSE